MAVIGTIVSSVYSARIVDLGGVFVLAPDQLAQAESSLGGAQSLAVSPGDQAGAFAAAAGDGFVDALSIGLRIAAFAVAGAFVVTWNFLPSHAAEPALEVKDRPEQFDAYRRWPSKKRLVLDALNHAMRPFDLIDTGSLRGDLDDYLGELGELARRMTEGKASDVLPDLIAASVRDPQPANLARRVHPLPPPALADDPRTWPATR